MSVHFHEELLAHMVPIDSISQHPDNPNSGDVDVIAESILTNGFYSPIIVQDSTGYILAGNHRYAALLSLGQTEAPVVRVDVTDGEALKILIADNRTAELAERDPRALEAVLKMIAAEDGLIGTGYDDEDFGELLRANRAVDHIPLDSIDYGDRGHGASKPGDIGTLRVVITANVDENGGTHPLTSGDVSELVAELAEMGYAAKGEYLA